jgi:hypothetical protein
VKQADLLYKPTLAFTLVSHTRLFQLFQRITILNKCLWFDSLCCDWIQKAAPQYLAMGLLTIPIEHPVITLRVVWSAKTDEVLLSETVAVMKKLNVIGVLSGTAEPGGNMAQEST